MVKRVKKGRRTKECNIKLFEEEENFAVVEEGKWSCPPACSILSYITAL
jgi:hypothetical protein